MSSVKSFKGCIIWYKSRYLGNIYLLYVSDIKDQLG